MIPRANTDNRESQSLPGVEAAKDYVCRLLSHIDCLCPYEGYDWDRLSKEEAAVFDLELADMPALTSIYAIYSDAIGMMCDARLTPDEIGKLRLDLPWLSYQKPSAGEFQRFAALFEISARKAHAFYTKQEFSLVRSGAMVYPDDEGFEFQAAIDAARSRSVACFGPTEGDSQ